MGSVLLVLAAALGSFLLLLYAWLARALHTLPAADESRRVLTADGHTLSLYRHRAPAGGPRRGTVLCLHGLGASHFNLQFPGHANLAAYLAAQGFDVWVAGLRGDHDASPPASGGPGFSFDAHVERDLPAILETVRSAAGSLQVHLVGHSMGGLLSYAYAVRHGDAELASITAIGSPLGFEERGAVVDHDENLRWVVRALPVLPVRLLARLVVPWLWLLRRTRYIRNQFNPDNMDLGYARRAMWNALSNVPRGMALQFEDWISQDAFRSADHALDYRAGLATLRVPVMVVAGAADHLARPSNCLRAVVCAGSAVKKALVAGRDHGHAHDYGHIDLIFGPRAPDDIFRPVAEFLVSVDEQGHARRGNGVSHGH
ncbi:MAG: alpha/beta fold hydrolase [Deltaproteobacteria bacterium]|nr:alpha/beta fold hydrolase [Deltaproteobacteria bacterium]